jgi:hypothetical protein
MRKMVDNGSILPKVAREEMVRNPKVHFDRPDKLVEDSLLTPTEKKKALDVWEQDAQQLLTASNEGMTGSEEGLDPDHSPKLGEIVRAKGRMGEKPKHKAGH